MPITHHLKETIMVDGNVHHLARQINQIATPAHLTPMSQLVVELDSERVFGALLHQLARSGQSFNFGTLTSEHPLVATDDRMAASSICFTIDGPGYVTEQLDEGRWLFDDLVRYRIVEVTGGERPIYITALADDAFADYAMYDGLTAGRVRYEKEGPVEKSEFTEEHLPGAIRMLGGFLTEVAARAASKGTVTADDVMEALFDAVDVDEEERKTITGEVNAGLDHLDLAQQMIINRALTKLQEEA